MSESNTYYMVRKKAVPEVLLKVVEAKRLLQTHKVETVQDAVEKVGISRSSFYKYQDDIMEFHDNAAGTTITLSVQIDDRPGILSDVLRTVATFDANILTIHQSIPVGGTASLSLSVQLVGAGQDTGDILSAIQEMEGVHQVKILARE